MKNTLRISGLAMAVAGVLAGCTNNPPPTEVVTPTEHTTVIHDKAPSAPHVTINTPPSSSNSVTNTTTTPNPDGSSTTTTQTTTTGGTTTTG